MTTITRILRRVGLTAGALVACFALAANDADAATKYTVASGNWEAAGTWSGSTVPSSSDDVIILSGHTVYTGNTTQNTTYGIRSFEIRPNGVVLSGTNTWRTLITTSNNGPTGYAVLNRGMYQGQINRTTVIHVAGNLRTDGSQISSRSSQLMNGFSWGFNNGAHSGNQWQHGHTGNNGDATAGVCLVLVGAPGASVNTIEQAGAITIDTTTAAGPDALPRTYIKAPYELKSNLEMNAFEQRVELGGSLDLNGYRLQVQGPLDVGDPGFNTVNYSLNSSLAQQYVTLANMTTVPSTPNRLWGGSTTVVSYTTIPKKVSSPFGSGWTNSQGNNGTFNFYGQNVSDIWISINGWIGFLSTYTSSYYYNLIPNINYANGIACVGYAQGCAATSHHVDWAIVPWSYISANTSKFPGYTANSDRLVVEWATCYAASSTGTQYMYQIHLEENTNKIFYHFGSTNMTTPNWDTSNGYSTIGVEDQGGNNGTTYNGQGLVYSLEPNNTLMFTPQYITNPQSTLRIGDGAGTTNQNSWPQLRITAGGANTWGTGGIVLIPNNENGSAFIGAAVNMIGAAKLQIYGQPSLPSGLQGWTNAGRAPTFWILGYFAVGGTSEVDVVVPSTVTNPYNSMLQVGQALDFIDNSVVPPLPSQGVVRLTGNNGTYNSSNPTGPQPFPVMLVQGGVGGSSNFVTDGNWHGTPGGTKPGIDTSGIILDDSTFVHQGGLAVSDGFIFQASGGNPGSAWGRHSVYIGLAANGAIPIANGTNLAVGGPGTVWNLDGVAMSVNGNRQAVNGGGGNVFLSGGAFFGHRGLASNLPADGSIGMVDINGNLQVTGAAEYRQGDVMPWTAPNGPMGSTPTGSTSGTTVRILGQGTIPPGLGVGPQSLQRRAPLGNVSIDDGGTMQSVNKNNILVFIGEKWHSSSVTIKIHPWKVSNLTHGQQVTFTASGGDGNYTYSLLSDTGSPQGSITGNVYTAGAAGGSGNNAGTAIVRVTDGNGEFFDAVVTYGPPAGGPLAIFPGWIDTSIYYGYVLYIRTGVSGFNPTVTFRAYAGSPPYTWTRGGNGSLGTPYNGNGTAADSVVFTGGTGTTVASVTLSDSTGTTRYAYIYHTTSTSYGDYYPTPYYFRHLHVGDTQQLHIRSAATNGTAPTWTFTTNTAQATVNGSTKSATGYNVTLMAGSVGGTAVYSNLAYGTCTFTNNLGTAVTGYFYTYTTALPSDLGISPTLIEGLEPNNTSGNNPASQFTFVASKGKPSYTWGMAQNGGGTPAATISGSGVYKAGGNSTADDQITLQDSTGISLIATIRKGLPTPATGNSYVCVPGARTLFTNSTANAVDQIVFADSNDDFGKFQVLKTLGTGNGEKVLPASLEITPILLTVIAGTSHTFSVPGDTTTTFRWQVTGNNSGATPTGQVNGNTFTYTAGSTTGTVDTIRCTDPNGKIARATVNVVSSGGSSPLQVRPRYMYYLKPGQQIALRTAGGKGSLTWSLTQNQSGGGVNGSGVYTAGTSVGTYSWDRIQVSDSSGDVDYAYFGVYNNTTTTFYVHPAYAYYDYNTGAGKSLNGFDPGQVLNITTTNGATNGKWTYQTNASGGTLAGSGLGASWTAGGTGNVTDYIQSGNGSSTWLCYYKVLPPPMGVSPSEASVFGGTQMNFTTSGGGPTKTWSIVKNDSGATLNGSGGTATYSAGMSAGIDKIRVSDGTSFAEVSISVLSQANPTQIICSHLDVWHGELDLNGRPFLVRRDATDPTNGDGVAFFNNGGVSGASNPKLSMSGSASLTTHGTFIWNPNADENITGGTLRIGGSMKITDTQGGPTFDLSDNSSTNLLYLDGKTADSPVSGPPYSKVEIWRAETTGGTPTTQPLNVYDITVDGANTSSPGTNTFDFFGPVCYANNYSTVNSPTVTGTTPAPQGSCSSGSSLPPGFTLWSNPSANNFPTGGTQASPAVVNTGIWIRAGNDTTTPWQTQGVGCWTVTGWVVVNGGLVVENGCVDIQGTLVVNGDVYFGIGTLAQDRNLNPRLVMTTKAGTEPVQLNVMESGPGTGGGFFWNSGSSQNITRGLISVENSFKIADDPGTSGSQTNRIFQMLGGAGTPVTLRMDGAGQEAGTSTEPAAARVYRIDASGSAQTLDVDNLDLNKTNKTDLVDLWGQVDVHNQWDVNRGTVLSSLSWTVHVLGAQWNTARGNQVVYDTTGGSIGSNSWPMLAVWLDGQASVPVVTVSTTSTGVMPMLPEVNVNHAGTGVGDGANLGTNINATRWWVHDGRFDPNGHTLTTTFDVAIGLGTSIATDRANAPEIFMNGASDQVLAGRHFLFNPGAIETVTAGVLGAQGDFSITDDPGTTAPQTNRIFDLTQPASTSTVLLTGSDLPGPTPVRIFRQDPNNNALQLNLFNFTVNKTAGSTVQLWSNVAVQGLMLLQSGNIAATNGTLGIFGNWTTTGGNYVGFGTGIAPSPYGVTINGTANQTFSASTGSPVPSLIVNKTAGTVTIASGAVFEVNGNMWIVDGTVDINTGTLRILGDLIIASPDVMSPLSGNIGNGFPQAVTNTRNNAPEIKADNGSTKGVLDIRRRSSSQGGTFRFEGGAVETLEHADIYIGRHGYFTDDPGTAAPATNRVFDLNVGTSQVTTLLEINGQDNSTFWRQDAYKSAGSPGGVGATLDVDNLNIRKTQQSVTVTFVTPIQIWGQYNQIQGTVQSGTMYVNGGWSATGGAYGATVSIVVQSTQQQTFSSAVTLPNLFINKTGGWVRVANGQTLQTGNFTIWQGLVDLNGGTLDVFGTFSAGINTSPNTNTSVNLIISSSAGTTNGGTLNVHSTGTTDGNFWFFQGCTATIDTGIIYVDGDFYVNDGAFQMTDAADAAPGSVLEMRNNRASAANLWADQPAAAPVVNVFDLTLNKSGSGVGATVNVGSTVTVANALVVKGSTIVNGQLGTGSPIQVLGTISTTGATGLFTSQTVVEIEGTTAQTLSSTIPLPIVYINKPNTTVVSINGTLITGIFIITTGTLDLNGGTLTVNGYFQNGTGAASPTPAPNILINQAGSTLQVRAPTSAATDGTFYWLSDATGTVTDGLIEIEGGMDVRSTSWAPSGNNLVKFNRNRGSSVVAGSTVPVGSELLVFQDLEVAKAGTSPGNQVNLNFSDVQVNGTFTLTSGVVNNSLGASGFMLRLMGALQVTGGSFTTNSWVSFRGAGTQNAGGAGGSLPNVQILKTGTGTASEVIFSGTMTLNSVLVDDGVFWVTDPGSGSTNITVTTSVTIGSNNLTQTRNWAPTFRMSTSGTLSFTVGTSFNFWAGSVEDIQSGTLRLNGSFNLQEDSTGSAAAGTFFDLSQPSGSSTVEFIGSTAASLFLTDESAAATNLELFNLTINKTTGVAVTATGPVYVLGTLTMQGGLLGTSGAGIIHIQGNWTHTGGGYVSGSNLVLDGAGTQQLQTSGTAVLPSITIDKASGIAEVPQGQTAQIGLPTAGELFWVKQGTFALNGGTLVVNGVFFVADSNNPTSQTVAPTFTDTGSQASGGVLDVNATTNPPSGFSVDGDMVVGTNGTGNSPATATALSAGTLRVEHRFAIDDPNFTTTGTCLVQLDGNAGTQGAGEIFTVRPTGNPLLVIAHLEVAKTGGGSGQTARLLSPIVVNGNVTLTSGTFDLANQSRFDVGGNWTAAAGMTVVPTITPVAFVGSTASTITVNSTTANFFDIFLNKNAGATAITVTSTSSPQQAVVAERQFIVQQGTATITAGTQLTVGAGSWTGNCLIGDGTGTATGVISPGATLAIGSTGTFAVHQASTFVQVGTGASARARLTSVQPGSARFTGIINGTWQVEWFEVSSVDNNGLQLGSTVQVTGATNDLSDGLWDYPATAGSPAHGILNLESTDLTNSLLPSATFRNIFQNTANTTNVFNVSASAFTPNIRFLNATGALSGEALDIEPTGPGPIYWNVATLQFAVATNTPPASNVLPGTNNVPLAAWTITETSNGEGANITSLTITHTGTGAADLSNLRLYIDADASGTVTPADGSPIGTAGGFTGGQVTYTGSPLIAVNSGGTVQILLVGDVSGSASVPSTYQVEITQASDVTAVGNPSGQPAQIPGSFASTGSTITLVNSGQITVALGAQNPAAGNFLSGQTNVTMGQWTLTAGPLENHNITQIAFTTAITGNATLAGVNARLYLDTGSVPGAWDATDTQIGTGSSTYSGSTVTFTPASAIALNAGQSITVILVHDFPTLTAPATYQSMLSTVTATGQTSSNNSGQIGTPQANVQSVSNSGSVTVSLGSSSPTATGVVKTASNHVMAQFQVQVSAAEAMSLSSWVVNDAGSASQSTAVTRVRLHIDGNNNGVYDGTTTDPQVGGNATFSGTTATVSISPAWTLGAGTTTNFLVIYDLSGSGTAGNTLNAQILNNSALSLTGQSSSNTVNATATPSYPVSGGAWTLTDGAPVLAVASGTNNPASGTIPAGTDVPMLQANITATGENQTISQIQVSTSGSLNDATAVAGVKIWEDANGDGTVDAGDTQLGTTQTFSADDGTVTFSGLSWSITSGGANAKDLLVTYTFNIAAVQPNDTVTATLASITATGDNSSSSSTVNNVPFNGNQQTVAVPGTLTVASGSRDPAPQTVPGGTTALPVWQLRVSAGAAEDIVVTGITLDTVIGSFPAPSTPVNFFGTVRLFWDANNNGLLDPGVDVLIARPLTFTGATAPQTLAWTGPQNGLSQRVSANSSQNWLVVADIVNTTPGSQGSFELTGGNMNIQGLNSGLNETTGLGLGGLPRQTSWVTVGTTGTVTVFKGAQTSPIRTEPAGTAGVPVAQFTVRGSVAEAATLSSVTVTGFGSGNESTELGNVQLWQDVNGNGRVDAGEPQLGTTQTYAADNGTVTFSGLSATVPGGPVTGTGDLHLVVTYDIAAGAAAGSTFFAQIRANTDLTVTGNVSSATLTPSGVPVAGNQLTVGTTPQLLLSRGTPWPNPIYLPPANLPGSNIVVAPLRLEATNAGGIDVQSLTLWAMGIGDDTAITAKVYQDVNGNGALDAGDTLLGTTAPGGYATDNGSWTLTLSPVVTIAQGGQTQFLVVYDVPSAALGDTFQLHVAPGDISATLTSSATAAQIMGSLIQSPPIVIDSPPTFGGPVVVAAGSSGGGCFIATAAAGVHSTLVADLQAGRDAFLPAGIVSAYYRTSPPVAAAVANAPAAAAGVRGGLAPWAGWAASSPVWPLGLLILLAGVALVLLRRRV